MTMTAFLYNYKDTVGPSPSFTMTEQNTRHCASIHVGVHKSWEWLVAHSCLVSGKTDLNKVKTG